MALLISALLLVAAAVLLLNQFANRQRGKREVARRLQGQMARDSRVGGWLRLLGDTRFGQRSVSLDSETQLMLNRLGWRRAHDRSLYAAFQVGAPMVLLGFVLLGQWLFYPEVTYPFLAPLFALGIGYLLPKRLLALAAARRQKGLALEVSSFIPLLRILFESGMAVEQALRVLSGEGQQLLPILSGELRMVLVRVDSGLELGEELSKTANLLAVDEFSDTCVILNQLIHQGGGAMKSLLTLKQLLDDRRLTQLQEYISKLSAKMSIVMMVFLFPALLIVLAGPGFTAIGRALSSS
ncbi:type II secretion system F family protein [Pseudomonas sp. MH10]|uniref:type II secretion system F family protein n=1 Tax=Pseudomonas sp. MH10 TaxID=3048627 RepID=UPI002AC98BE8|nr:type II secretion system F family protein [Pseudomonas sp. MH10]MEB0041631.1 type II secretion system F family protein [Pseudomonas sp. MH10]WPX61944.1 type II secretion system F family protein [Pseudomonas sp. MH10]